MVQKLGLLRYTANTAYRGICGCGKNTVPYRNNASRAVFSPFSRGRIPQIPHTAVFAVFAVFAVLSHCGIAVFAVFAVYRRCGNAVFAVFAVFF